MKSEMESQEKCSGNFNIILFYFIFYALNVINNDDGMRTRGKDEINNFPN